MRKLTDNLFVSEQLSLDDIASAAEAGIKTIINNRPDGEMPMQPRTADLAAAAAKLDVAYHDIPFSRQIMPGQIDAFAKILEDTDELVLAFCRSGTRSTTIWALSQAGKLGADEIVGAAAGAGYDLTHLHAMLKQAAE